MSTRIGIKPNKGDNNRDVYIDYSVAASKRGIDMLLNKVNGRAFQSEVPMSSNNERSRPVLRKKLCEAKVALITDGGLVPKGNPDNMPTTNSNKFCIYSLNAQQGLSAQNYEISHQGYDNGFVLQDPNRLLPVDMLREAERDGIIGKLWDLFYTTTGVMTSVENATDIGRRIASSLRESDLDAAIVTSTCGTSTRCGAIIAQEIEKQGIPVVQVTNLTQIAEGYGISRILKGYNICYLFGNPSLSEEGERSLRRELVHNMLRLFE